MRAAMKLIRPSATDWASVSPSAHEPGRWQLTWWDEHGPSGHTCRDTPRECVKEAIRDGMVPDSADGLDADEALALMYSEQAAHEAARARAHAWLRGDEW